MTSKLSSNLLVITLLSSQHTSAMEFPFPAPEPAESVEWYDADDVPDSPLRTLANPRRPRSDDLDELKIALTKPSRRQRTSWHLPRISHNQMQLLALTLLACGTTALQIGPNRYLGPAEIEQATGITDLNEQLQWINDNYPGPERVLSVAAMCPVSKRFLVNGFVDIFYAVCPKACPVFEGNAGVTGLLSECTYACLNYLAPLVEQCAAPGN